MPVGDVPGLSEGAQIIIALLSTVGTIVVAGFAWLGVRANQTRKHALSAAIDSAATVEQVRNAHTTNLREEQDERHTETIKKLDDQTRSIGGLKRDIGRLADVALEQQRQSREDRARLDAHLDSLTHKENR